MANMVRSSKTLIVGSGITGATIAHLLHDAKRALQCGGDVVIMWEKNNITGGRMMARSFRKNRAVHVDIGAQYLTNFNSANDDIRAMLLDKAKLSKFQESQIAQDPARAPSYTDHLVASGAHGYRNVVNFLLTDAQLHVSREVDRFEVLDEMRIKVFSKDGHEEIVNDLVLTCPIPNVLSIVENSGFQAEPKQLAALQRIEYSQRFALALLFDKSIKEHVDKLGWTAKYVAKQDDDIIRYLCWDNLKKQKKQQDDVFTLLVHTSVPFGVNHMENQNSEILATIMKSVNKLLPFLPEPEDSLLHRWRMSQVTTTYQEAAGAEPVPSITLSKSPRIVVAGDAFLGSVFDNCLLSAKHATTGILETRHVSSGL